MQVKLKNKARIDNRSKSILELHLLQSISFHPVWCQAITPINVDMKMSPAQCQPFCSHFSVLMFPCLFSPQIVIPFFSLFVKDMYFLNEGCTNKLSGGHINFEVSKNNDWRTRFILKYTVRCHYNAVNFLQNPHNRHPIAHPCWLIIPWTIGNKLLFNFYWNTMIFIIGNAFGNVWKRLALWLWPQNVKNMFVN